LMLAKKKKGGGSRTAPAVTVAEAPAAIEAPPAAEEQPFTPGEDTFPLNEGAWEHRRVSTEGLSFDKVLEAVSGCVSDDAALEEFVQTNRDLLDYRWLYRLTASMLRAQNLGEDARATELRELRARVVKATQNFDAPLFRQVGEAEGRLGQMLGRYAAANQPNPSAAEVVKAAGSTSAQAFAFWLVMVAAVAAWESKLSVPSVAGMAKGKLAELAEVLSALEDSPQFLENSGVGQLGVLLGMPNQVLPGADTQQARGVIDSLGLTADELAQLTRRLGCVSCQASRHAFQAYNPLVQKSAAMYDVLLYGSLQPLNAPDIASPERTEYTSNLIKIAEDADKQFPEREVEIFW